MHKHISDFEPNNRNKRLVDFASEQVENKFEVSRRKWNAYWLFWWIDFYKWSSYQVQGHDCWTKTAAFLQSANAHQAFSYAETLNDLVSLFEAIPDSPLPAKHSILHSDFSFLNNRQVTVNKVRSLQIRDACQKQDAMYAYLWLILSSYKLSLIVHYIGPQFWWGRGQLRPWDA